jgi:S-adenosylmethionine decarboxylase
MRNVFKQIKNWATKGNSKEKGVIKKFLSETLGAASGSNWKELAPDIQRQRLVVEGTLTDQFESQEMYFYASKLTKLLKMKAITTPILNYSPDYGWCAFCHWKESGMHIYGWDNHNPVFFSVDIYTCKTFEAQEVVKFTKEFFGDRLLDIVWKE